MSGKAAAMDVRMATAMAGGVANVARFCAEQGISRTTFYKWRIRFAEDGVDGLQERSRRPATNPRACPGEVEDLIVFWRKRLDEDGKDNGPDSIKWQLSLQADVGDGPMSGLKVPSRATIARVLTRRGLVVPQPRKRPRSSLHRFTYSRPNECWQSDWTEWFLAGDARQTRRAKGAKGQRKARAEALGVRVAIAASMDDHSRYLVAINAGPADATAEQVWDVFTAGFAECGIPVRSLTDNGLCYSGQRRGTEVANERNLRALGVQPIASSPRHPQTCGKIERFWQTLKRWLNARPIAHDLGELTAQLQEFRHYYNHERPHRALRAKTPHATPAEAFAATVKARPPERPLPATVFVDHVTVTSSGNALSGPFFISLGNAWAGHHVQAVREGNHVAVFAGARLLRVLTADPTRRYQPAPPGRPRNKRGHREPTT